MKIVKYKFLSCEINHGTEEKPDIEQIFLEKSIECATQAQYDANLPIVLAEAYNGEYTVEGEFEDESTEPSQLDRVEAQATYTAMMTDTLLEV